MAIKSLGAVSDAMWCALAFSVNERNAGQSMIYNIMCHLVE